MPAICLTLAEESLAGLERKLSCYGGQVSLIEVRLDYLRPFGIPRLPESKGTAFLATLRAAREGGRFEGPENDRISLLSEAAARGFDWIDLEHDVEPLELPRRVRVVRSLHDFSGDKGLDEAFRSLGRYPADVYKLAVATQSTRRLVELLEWREERRDRSDLLVIGMGEYGRPSRLLGSFLGNPWTYVAEGPGDTVAPGQFSLEETVALYRYESWKETPELYGVIGNPVSHSRSPQLHNGLFGRYGMNRLYIPLPLDDVDPWFAYLEHSRLPFRGFSVTIPHKAKVPRHTIPADAPQRTANTLTRVEAGWKADNTDVDGFLRPLLRRTDSLEGRRAVVLGNGGVAESVVPALLAQGMEVVVAGRNAGRCQAFAERLGCSWRPLSELDERAYLCVNTTPVGQSPRVEESPLEAGQISFEVVYDLIYNPQTTKLMVMAAAAGAQTISGVEMFVEQAAGQFAIWTGVDPDRSLMREILEVKA